MRDEPTAAERPGVAGRLVAAGVVDRAYVEAQAGRRFPDDLAAARHVVKNGLCSPHPLVDLASLPDWVREALGRGEAGSLLKYLRGPGLRKPCSPVFDPTALVADPAAVAAHPAGALGVFLAAADDESPLPGRPDLSLGRLRAALVEHAGLLREQRGALGPRTTETWDEEAERAWKAQWSAAPPPTADDGGPLVSVVMPVRDRAAIVGTALASLSAQTLTDWELVVVDDGSTDDTATVLDGWADRDPRIRVLRQPPGGVSAARNTALTAARGRYVAFLDSDNQWRPDFLRLAVTAMAGQGLRAAYAGMVLRDTEDQSRMVHRAFQGSLAELLVVNHVDLNVLVVERDLAVAVDGFDTTLRRWVDHDFALRLARRVELRLLPFVAVDYDNSMETADRITTSESSSWQWVVLGQHWVDWPAVTAAVAQRVPGRVSVAIPTWNDAGMTIRAVRALLRHRDGLDLEIVVVDNGSQAEFAMSLAAEFAGRPEVVHVRVPRNLNFAIGSNLGFAHGTGEHVLFLNNDTEVRAGWWQPLLPHLTDSPDNTVLGVQPLLLYPDDTIQSAGTVFPITEGLPCHYLVDHPPADADKIVDRRFHAMTAAALLMRAADVAALRGFDPIYVNGNEDIDLCLRAGELRPGTAFVLEPASRITHFEGKTFGRTDQITENRRHFWRRWAGRMPARESNRWVEAGFEIAHIEGEPIDFPRPRPIIIRPRPQLPADGSAPALRWGLKIPSVAGERGDAWGDTHFAGSLATSLRGQGQDAVVYRHWSHHTPPSKYDDVVLGLRGLDVIHPIPGKVNVLWVISHPDDVPPTELFGWDLVYAASASWAATMSERSGREVGVLLQATDLALRADTTRPAGTGERAVFVGQTLPHRVRPIVHDALEAGVAIDVHGPNWPGVIPDDAIASAYVANDRLMGVYRDHGLVLADHHGDMAREGFLANRLFDAVASGARVVSDDVPGTEVFEGAVQVYRSVAELSELCSPAGRARFPDEAEMAAIADRVAAAHSFDARAAQLLADVVPVWERKRL